MSTTDLHDLGKIIICASIKYEGKEIRANSIVNYKGKNCLCALVAHQKNSSKYVEGSLEEKDKTIIVNVIEEWKLKYKPGEENRE